MSVWRNWSGLESAAPARDLTPGSTEEVAVAFGIAIPLAALAGVWALTGLRSAERG